MEVFAKIHPSEINANQFSDTQLIIRIRNDKKEQFWYEGEVNLPNQLSLTPDQTLSKAKIRFGILKSNGEIEKYVKVYGSKYTDASSYAIALSIYEYDKDGAVSERKDSSIDLQCKPAMSETIK